jgi:hypothetical protein
MAHKGSLVSDMPLEASGLPSVLNSPCPQLYPPGFPGPLLLGCLGCTHLGQTHWPSSPFSSSSVTCEVYRSHVFIRVPRVRQGKGQACTMVFMASVCLLVKASMNRGGIAVWAVSPEQRWPGPRSSAGSALPAAGGWVGP